MLRQLKKVGLSVLILVSSSVSYASEEFIEGTHYDTYESSPATKTPTFIEYLSFFCPACEKLNTYQDEIYKSVPKNVLKRRVSVDLIKKTSPAGFLALAKVMVVNDELYKSIGNSLVDIVFAAIHKERAVITPSLVSKLITVIDAQYPDVDIVNLYKSEKVAEVANFLIRNQQLMKNRGMLNSVPRIIINGRHVVNLGALDSNNFFKELHELTKHLYEVDYGQSTSIN